MACAQFENVHFPKESLIRLTKPEPEPLSRGFESGHAAATYRLQKKCWICFIQNIQKSLLLTHVLYEIVCCPVKLLKMLVKSVYATWGVMELQKISKRKKIMLTYKV